jgi:hypothetical protein
MSNARVKLRSQSMGKNEGKVKRLDKEINEGYRTNEIMMLSASNGQTTIGHLVEDGKERYKED